MPKTTGSGEGSNVWDGNVEAPGVEETFSVKHAPAVAGVEPVLVEAEVPVGVRAEAATAKASAKGAKAK